MLKGPVKRLPIQRRLLKTKRVEARRTRASGQVVCVAARQPPGVCPERVRLGGQRADTPLIYPEKRVALCGLEKDFGFASLSGHLRSPVMLY